MINFKFAQCKLSQTLIFLMIVFNLLGSSLTKAEVIFAEKPSLTPPPLEKPSLTPPPLEKPSLTPPPLEKPSLTPPPLEKPSLTSPPLDRENQQRKPQPLGCKLLTVCPKKQQLGCRTYLECPKE